VFSEMPKTKFLRVHGNKIRQLAYVFSVNRVLLSAEMGQVSKFGQTEVITVEVLATESSKGTAFTFGLTVRGMLVNGFKMRCRARVLLTGLMVVTSKASSRME
jgi:hypothetical protein